MDFENVKKYIDEAVKTDNYGDFFDSIEKKYHKMGCIVIDTPKDIQVKKIWKKPGITSELVITLDNKKFEEVIKSATLKTNKAKPEKIDIKGMTVKKIIDQVKKNIVDFKPKTV